MVENKAVTPTQISVFYRFFSFAQPLISRCCCRWLFNKLNCPTNIHNSRGLIANKSGKSSDL